MEKSSVKALVAWRLSIKWEGKYRTSPEYATEELACAAIVAFLKNTKCPRYLPVTIERVTRYVAAE